MIRALSTATESRVQPLRSSRATGSLPFTMDDRASWTCGLAKTVWHPRGTQLLLDLAGESIGGVAMPSCQGPTTGSSLGASSLILLQRCGKPLDVFVDDLLVLNAQIEALVVEQIGRVVEVSLLPAANKAMTTTNNAITATLPTSTFAKTSPHQ